MSFIFQPATTRIANPDFAASVAELSRTSRDRISVSASALEALARGDADQIDQIFTEDVRFRSPHVSVRSRADLRREVGEPDSALDEIDVTVLVTIMNESAAALEWRLEVTLTAPILFGDNVLIEPTGERVQLQGAAFAEFSGDRIRAFRCYFDDSEMLDGVPGLVHPLRFTARWSGVSGERDAP